MCLSHCHPLLHSITTLALCPTPTLQSALLDFTLSDFTRFSSTITDHPEPPQNGTENRPRRSRTAILVPIAGSNNNSKTRSLRLQARIHKNAWASRLQVVHNTLSTILTLAMAVYCNLQASMPFLQPYPGLPCPLCTPYPVHYYSTTTTALLRTHKISMLSSMSQTILHPQTPSPCINPGYGQMTLQYQAQPSRSPLVSSLTEVEAV
jgi:hypothetical protein